MRTTVSVVVLCVVVAAGGGLVARSQAPNPASGPAPAFAYSEPGISPDGREIAFASGGDIWSVPSAGGEARLLVTDPATDRRPMFSPDGRELAFVSMRTGGGDIYVLALATGAVRRLTWDDGLDDLSGWSPDGRWIYFSSTGRDIASMNDVFRVEAAGGTPLAVSADRYVNEFDAAPSPDGRRLAVVARGNASAQWWRKGSSHLDQSEIWLMNLDGDPAYTAILPRGSRQVWPMWSGDGRTLFYVSDRAGAENIWSRPATAAGTDRKLTAFTDGRVLWPTVTPDGRTIAFERDFAIWTLDTGNGRASAVPITRRGAPAMPTPERVRQTSSFSDLALSPDGTQLAFVRDRRELRVMDLAAGSDRVVATGIFADTIGAPDLVWSPDGRWLAAFAIGAKRFTNVELVPLAGGVMRPATFLANAFANGLAWSSDGTFIVFSTNQRTESGELARVDLVPRAPRFREDLFRDLFSDPRPAGPPDRAATAASPAAATATPAERKPAPDPVMAGIRERLSFLPLGLDVRNVALSPDGKTAAAVASTAGQANIYAYPLDDLAADRPVARQITTTSGGKSNVQFLPDGREVIYLDGGRIQIANLERRDARPLAVTAEFTTDFARERQVVFDQAWALLRDNFFDPAFNGVDWEASHERYGRYAAGAATPDDLRRVISLMIGDLNASHLGISGGGAAAAIGRLGVDFDRRAFETSGRLVVTDVLPLGPAALAGGIGVGDTVAAIDGKAVDARTNLDERLANTINRRVVLGIAPAAGGPARDVVVRPVSQAAEKALRYRDWVDTNREYVLKASGGRLGYVHMINMSAAALDQLLIDLDVDNHRMDGVVIDIRNNSGGFVNAYALDIFTRQPYLRMSTRGVPEAPARGVLGQRALESPTVLVTNQHSLSDAEDFTEGYRALKLGPIVGEPTAGWIIYTWNEPLVDGSTLRLPRQRVKAADGSDMERAPRKVDVEVLRPLGESLIGRDAQLDEAVRVLIRRLGRAE